MDEGRVSRDEILAKLAVILADVLDLDEVPLAETTTADDVEGWDSVNHVRLLIAAEQAFGIRFASTEVGPMRKVGDLVDLIAAKRTSG